MQCLIIAAGMGRRLRSLAPSKPLAMLAGRPMIDHVMTAARAGGATRFLVVTGYEAGPLEAHLARRSADEGIEIAMVRNHDFEKPNGYSVLAAAPLLDDDHLLLMADHLFEPGIVAAMIAGPGPGALLLAIDRRRDNPLVDLDDATKVRQREENRILAIGKAIAPWHAIDTGIFRVGPALPRAIAASLAAGGSGSLSEGVQMLADQGLAFTRDVGDAWWLDVDDPRAFALAEAHLRDRSA